MAKFFVSLSLFLLFCKIQAKPFIDLEDDDAIYYNFPGTEIYGTPKESTGDLVAKWTPEMGNPEELGEYFEGDMLLPPSMAKSGYINTAYRWPNKEVPYVFSGKFCGKQNLNLQRPGCVTVKGTAIHEFMHALGFIHEHSRPERDNYVQIIYPNIITSAVSNFDTYSTSVVSDFGVTYDYGSVMHYGTFMQAGAVIGQRVGFSANDVQSIRNMYGC